jgi:hypothetical protein
LQFGVRSFRESSGATALSKSTDFNFAFIVIGLFAWLVRILRRALRDCHFHGNSLLSFARRLRELKPHFKGQNKGVIGNLVRFVLHLGDKFLRWHPGRFRDGNAERGSLCNWIRSLVW